MKYGFVIDNRKCIGCHACTVACKSEHDVPIGVNRTWVKQVETGTFPDTNRLFSVMRCNHCTNAPCVEICPTEALFIRDDGIVDFNNDRCIGCKSCMQACPYDAIYVDPETHTAATCNYCAHRVDVGLEPACVNVCPEHAIISGDLDDPASEIALLIATQPVNARKVEKGTQPNLFYIDGDPASLEPTATARSDQYVSSSQSEGVGHYARFAEKVLEGKSLVEMAKELSGEKGTSNRRNQRSIHLVMERARRVYDAPSKGVLWGWEVAGYIWTKAISTGLFLVLFLANFFVEDVEAMIIPSLVISLVFLGITTALLVKDLDKPTRFFYVVMRPQWNSWLVRGGYSLMLFGGTVTVYLLSSLLDWPIIGELSFWTSAILAPIVSTYTAFLFAQAKGRDFWQGPSLPFHMLGHSFLAGSASFAVIAFLLDLGPEWSSFIRMSLSLSILVNLLIITFEMLSKHPTSDGKETVRLIMSGKYSSKFWAGVIIIGNLVPLILTMNQSPELLALAGLTACLGIFITEHIWVDAPQQIDLS